MCVCACGGGVPVQNRSVDVFKVAAVRVLRLNAPFRGFCEPWSLESGGGRVSGEAAQGRWGQKVESGSGFWKPARWCLTGVGSGREAGLRSPLRTARPAAGTGQHGVEEGPGKAAGENKKEAAMGQSRSCPAQPCRPPCEVSPCSSHIWPFMDFLVGSG